MAFEVAIIGNPNVGKTSIFNLLTGTKQYVANWPGVTVEKKIGSYNFQNHEFRLIDLPGIYTLSAQSEDERVARDYFLNEAPDAIVVVADALNLERSMFLLMQLIEMNKPVILAINSIDEAEEKGKIINPEIISKTLNVPVVLTSAKKVKGISKLLQEIHKVAENTKNVRFELTYTKNITKFISTFKNEISKFQEYSSYNPSWLAVNFIEFSGENFNYPKDLLNTLKKEFDLKGLKEEYNNWKFNFISSLIKDCVISNGRTWSTRDILDHVLTHRVLGLMIYVLALFLVFSLTFNVAAPLSDLLDLAVSWLSDLTRNFIKIPWLSSLISDGIIGGVGGVLVFIPQIFALFFFMGILEETGYLPRAAFLVDKLVRKFGLSGRSFMSIILGFGCSVPAIMSTKTISNKKERLSLILSIPFASCSARLPVYVVLISAFFSKHAAEVMLLLYASSILLVLISAKILQIFVTQSKDIPFTIELPRFRMPTMRNLFFYTWNKGKHFLEKAGGIILIASIFIWFLSYFPNNGANINKSFAASIGRFFEPVTLHLGWNWITNTALLFGVAAKEVVVSTYTTLLNSNSENLTSSLSTILTPRSAIALLFFILGYVPCFATLGTIKAETNSYKWPIFSFFYTTVVAYILANFVYFIGGMVL